MCDLISQEHIRQDWCGVYDIYTYLNTQCFPGVREIVLETAADSSPEFKIPASFISHNIIDLYQVLFKYSLLFY